MVSNLALAITSQRTFWIGSCRTSMFWRKSSKMRVCIFTKSPTISMMPLKNFLNSNNIALNQVRSLWPRFRIRSCEITEVPIRLWIMITYSQGEGHCKTCSETKGTKWRSNDNPVGDWRARPECRQTTNQKASNRKFVRELRLHWSSVYTAQRRERILTSVRIIVAVPVTFRAAWGSPCDL